MTATEKAVLYIVKIKVQAGNRLNGALMNVIAQEISEVDLNMDFIADKFLTDWTERILEENKHNLHQKAENLRDMYSAIPAMKEELAEEIKKLSTNIDC